MADEQRPAVVLTDFHLRIIRTGGTDTIDLGGRVLAHNLPDVVENYREVNAGGFTPTRLGGSLNPLEASLDVIGPEGVSMHRFRQSKVVLTTLGYYEGTLEDKTDDRGCKFEMFGRLEGISHGQIVREEDNPTAITVGVNKFLVYEDLGGALEDEGNYTLVAEIDVRKLIDRVLQDGVWVDRMAQRRKALGLLRGA